MIDVYYWPTPNGHKITIALEEMGLDYTIKPVNIGAGEQFAPEFLAFSPNNRMPAIIDHDTGGDPQTVFESGAILLYLAEKTGQLMPASGPGRVAVMEWLMWQMGGFGPMLGQAHHFNFYAPEKIQYGMDRYSTEARRLYGVLDRRLAETPWVAGDDYTIADLAIFPWSRTYERQGVDINDFPHVQAWREKMMARPAVEKGMKVGAELRQDLSKLSKEEYQKLFGTKD
ncbi:MAG: glutathione S-transferase N-terminal domain-containing protein [Alphaproteobacteria bacterium]|nr:glutathione S-transferase N-terminal domain-containing protein [Alphaproteobacteria bacterium]